MRRHGQSGFSLPELLMVIALMGILSGISVWTMRGYQRTARLNSAVDMIGADIRKARLHVFTSAEEYYIDFEPKTSSYVLNGISRIQLPEGISFGADKEVTGRPTDPYTLPPKDGITFKGDGTENRALFLTKGLVIPTGAVYLTNGKETIAITVALSGHTTFWRSKGGTKWAEI